MLQETLIADLVRIGLEAFSSLVELLYRLGSVSGERHDALIC